ncbi:MAG: outer membrane beta-barrel protein [Pseudomonadota bacterium]
MISRRHIIAFWIGFACAAIAGLAFDASPAFAQTRFETTIQRPGPRPVDPDREPLRRPPATALPPGQPGDLLFPRQAPAAVPDVDADDTGNDAERDANGRLPTRPLGAPRDGDLRPALTPEQEDGRIIVGEPPAVQDGGDPSQVDQRTARERAAFDIPPAGFDPGAFAFDPGTFPTVTSPQAARRRQLFRFEPYQPLGIRMGSFLLFPELEVGMRSTNNLFNAPSGSRQSDIAGELIPSMRIVSDWNVHAVELRANGLFTFQNEFPDENERDYGIESRTRIDFTRRTNLETLSSLQVTREGRGSDDDPGANAARATITTAALAAALNHRFNRLSLQFRGSYAAIVFGEGEAANGNVITNDDRSYTVPAGGLRASWEFKPNLSIFGEAVFNQRRYNQAAQSDNILRDSFGQRWRVGVSFGTTSEILRGDVALGYALQDADAAQLRDIKGLTLDANLAWRLSPLTTMLFTANADTSETTTANTLGALTQTVGLEYRHSFRRNLIGAMRWSFTQGDFAGIALRERTLVYGLGLEYFINRNAAIIGQFDHTEFFSNEAGADYTRDEISIRLRLRR